MKYKILAGTYIQRRKWGKMGENYFEPLITLREVVYDDDEHYELDDYYYFRIFDDDYAEIRVRKEHVLVMQEAK